MERIVNLRTATLLLTLAAIGCGIETIENMPGGSWTQCGKDCLIELQAKNAVGVVASKVGVAPEERLIFTRNYHNPRLGSCMLVPRAEQSLLVIAALAAEGATYSIPTGFEECAEIRTNIRWSLFPDWGSELDVCSRTCAGWCFSFPQKMPNLLTQHAKCCTPSDPSRYSESLAACGAANASASGYFEGRQFPQVPAKQECGKPTDCPNEGDCRGGYCLSPTCGDGIKNAPGGKPESDIDLGGPCTKATIGKLCNSDIDCKSNACGMVEGRNVCLGQTGETCRDIAECKSKICSGSPMDPGTCRSPDMSACIIDEECDTQSACLEKVCTPKPMCKKIGVPGMPGQFCGPPVDQGGCPGLSPCPPNTPCKDNPWCQSKDCNMLCR